MDIKNIGFWILLVSVVVMVGSIYGIKKKKMFVEKAFVYGIVAAIMVQAFALFFIFSGNFLVVFMNALFISIVTHNMFTIFGFRMAKIYEKDQKGLFSFFLGNAIFGNAINFSLIGIASMSYAVYSKDPEFVAKIGQETMDVLTKTMKLITIDHIGTLLVSALASMIVTYCALAIFVKAYHTKKSQTNLKGILVLFSYYIVNLYIPSTNIQEGLQVSLYMAVSLAAYFFLKQVLEEKVIPTVQ